MGYGSRKLNVTHSLATNLLRRHFNAALLADLAFITHAFILSAKTFPVLCRSEYLLTEKTVLFRAERAVVYGLRLCNLAMRPASYHFGRGKPDFYRIKNVFCHLSFSPLLFIIAEIIDSVAIFFGKLV